MRYGKDQKERTRARIVAHASTRLRRDGLAGTGLRSLVGDAGLTHGAFYAHFPSRSDLLAEAVQRALRTTGSYFAAKVEAAPPGAALAAFVEEYLTMEHRAAPETGCAAAALGSEIGREDAATRLAFAEGVDRIVETVADSLPPGGSDRDRRARARAIFAGMIGALQLARAAEEADALSMLTEAREAALATGRLPWPEERR